MHARKSRRRKLPRLFFMRKGEVETQVRNGTLETWMSKVREWAASHPQRDYVVDDSRENDEMGKKNLTHVRLIFRDWQRDGISVDHDDECMERLHFSSFHSGTVFDGEIWLSKACLKELKEDMAATGAEPVFRLRLK